MKRKNIGCLIGLVFWGVVFFCYIYFFQVRPRLKKEEIPQISAEEILADERRAQAFRNALDEAGKYTVEGNIVIPDAGQWKEFGRIASEYFPESNMKPSKEEKR